ncbi:MAG: septum formation protein Maf [Candidatus Cloacimonetes bacterium]|nr:septum formation protein Maf [Candidatus Cloacimonadota bacterium]
MLHNLLKNKDIILASKSPRRAFLLQQIGLKFSQISSNIEEVENEMSPEDFVVYYSLKKAEKIFKSNPNSFVIGVDTIVFIDNKIIGKPKNRNQAKKFLQTLSGNCHTVLSGISILYKDKIISRVEKTKVCFKQILEKDIEEYIKTNEPMDKAGAYGIQGFGSQFIKKIEGCYFNVMGFPIPLFYEMVQKTLKVSKTLKVFIH